MTRRSLLTHGSALVTLAALGGVTSSSVALGDGRRSFRPYGSLRAPDHNGVRLPPGFTSRVVARTGDRVGSSSYRWHERPDGGACFAAEDGGFIYVSNSEVGSGGGGAGAIRFDNDANIVDAYPILEGTDRNCSGGATPWGTWLSCEEAGANGQVYECDPSGARPAQRRAALGSFNHEAVEVVSDAQALFLTEDTAEGRLYRFLPSTWPDLRSGRLQAAAVADDGTVRWVDVADDQPDRSDDTTPFDGAEGLASTGNSLLMSTKGDRRLWRYDIASSRIDVIHDCISAPNTVLDSVDNLTIDHGTGDLFVAEDGRTMDLAIVTTTPGEPLDIAGFARFEGHRGSEVTGPAISPDRTTLLVSSQRGTSGRGITYAISGPFRSGDAHTPPSEFSPGEAASRPVAYDDAGSTSGLRPATRQWRPGDP